MNQFPHVVSLCLAPFHVHTERAQSQRSARHSSILRRVRCCSPRVTFTYSARTFSQNLATLAPHSSEDTELMSYKVRRALLATRTCLRGTAKVLLAGHSFALANIANVCVYSRT